MNTTVGINTSLPQYERPWIRDEIFASTLTAVSLYLVISLAIFECKHSTKEKKETDLKSKIGTFLSGGSLCLVAIVFTVIRCFFEQIELRLGRTSDLACRIYQHELAEVYHLALTSLYLLLWTRQLKLYRHRALRHLSSKLLRFVSYTVLLGILGSSIASVTSYITTFTLIASPNGCIYDLSAFNPDDPPSSLPGILLFVIAVVFQFSLLGLMIYPLVKHYKVHMCGQESSATKKHQNVRKTIVRLTICTTICVISDGVASYLLVFVHDGITPIMFWANIYTVNLLFNITAVVCSFADWRKRLFPCYKGDYDVVAGTSASSGSSTV